MNMTEAYEIDASTATREQLQEALVFIESDYEGYGELVSAFTSPCPPADISFIDAATAYTKANTRLAVLKTHLNKGGK